MYANVNRLLCLLHWQLENIFSYYLQFFQPYVFSEIKLYVQSDYTLSLTTVLERPIYVSPAFYKQSPKPFFYDF